MKEIIFSFCLAGAQPEATEQLCGLQGGDRYQPAGEQEAVGGKRVPPAGTAANAEGKGEAVQWHREAAAGEQHPANKGAKAPCSHNLLRLSRIMCLYRALDAFFKVGFIFQVTEQNNAQQSMKTQHEFEKAQVYSFTSATEGNSCKVSCVLKISKTLFFFSFFSVPLSSPSCWTSLAICSHPCPNSRSKAKDCSKKTKGWKSRPLECCRKSGCNGKAKRAASTKPQWLSRSRLTQ